MFVCLFAFDGIIIAQRKQDCKHFLKILLNIFCCDYTTIGCNYIWWKPSAIFLKSSYQDINPVSQYIIVIFGYNKPTNPVCNVYFKPSSRCTHKKWANFLKRHTRAHIKSGAICTGTQGVVVWYRHIENDNFFTSSTSDSKAVRLWDKKMILVSITQQDGRFQKCNFLLNLKLLLTSGGEYDILVKDFEKRIWAELGIVSLCILYIIICIYVLVYA